jgi:hypothetical protein
VAHQLDRQLVRDESALVEERLDLPAERGAGGDRSAEELARRDVRDAVLVGDALRLRSLPRPLRTENEDVQRKNPS